MHSEIRDTSVQLDLSHVNCAEEPWVHIHRQSRQSRLGMFYKKFTISTEITTAGTFEFLNKKLPSLILILVNIS